MAGSTEYAELEARNHDKATEWSGVILDGERFRPFPEVSILDFDGLAEHEFSEWFGRMLRAGEPFAIRDFHRKEHWRRDILCLENLIAQVGEATPLRPNQGQRSQGFHLKNLLDEPRKSAQSPKSKIPSGSLYARDIRCPPPWQEALDRLLPSETKCCGSIDLFRFLPKEAYAESMMVYAGSRHSHSGFHRCFDGTTSCNLLLETQGIGTENAHSICLGTNQESQELFDQFIESHGASPYSDWTLMVFEQLKSVNFPIYFRKQLVGDLVVFPGSTAHQICNSASYSLKLVWNILNVEALGSFLNSIQPTYKKLCQPDQGRIPLVPYYAVSALVSGNSRSEDRVPSNDFTFLLNTLTRIIEEEDFGMQESQVTPRKLDTTQGLIVECNYCGSSIFNRHLHCYECVDFDLCIHCFVHGRSCQHIDRYDWVELHQRETLLALIHKASSNAGPPQSNASPNAKPLAVIANESLTKRRSKNVKLCHLCRDSHPEWKGMSCTQCSAFFCYRGLYRHFDVEPLEFLGSIEPWVCQKCQKSCNCRCCNFENPKQSRTKPPTRRIRPIDPRGRMPGFSDNVFDRRKTKTAKATATATATPPTATPATPSVRQMSPSSERSQTKRPKITLPKPPTDEIGLSQLLYNGQALTPKTSPTSLTSVASVPLHNSTSVRKPRPTGLDYLVGGNNDLASRKSTPDYTTTTTNESRRSIPIPSLMAEDTSANPDIEDLERKIATLKAYLQDVELLSLATTRAKLSDHLRLLQQQLTTAKEQRVNSLLYGLQRDFPEIGSIAATEAKSLGLSKRDREL